MLISRSASVAKLFFILSISGLLIYVVLGVYSLRNSTQSTLDPNKYMKTYQENPEKIDSNLKYILFDTKNLVLSSFVAGQQLFLDYQCPHVNCFLTTDVKTLKNKDEFDAVVVNVTDLADIKLPATRPQKQLYIFYGKEPSDHIPICRKDVDNFFNYTWSYKLSSDIVSPFFAVEDMNATIVAPSKDVEWPMSIKKSSIKNDHLIKLKNKNKAVAMIPRSCKDKDGKIFAYRLKKALAVYHEVLHIFACDMKFPREGWGDAVAISKEYFFVLVTTDSMAQDYVTDKVLKAYWNSAVPIVKARADLTKFLPPGSYVNAHLQTPEQIAALIHYSINNPSVYQAFFKWRNFYTMHKRGEFDGICQLCSILNNGNFHSSSAANLRDWWESTKTNPLKCAKN